MSALAVLALCLLAYTAGAWGLADLFAMQPRGAMRLWDSGKAVPGPGEIEAARRTLESALRLEPGDPGIKEELGRVHTRAAIAADSPPHVSPHSEIALSYFRAAVRERPVSSYAWAAIATTKWTMRRADAEFERALQEAARLGPWEPEVQLAVADAGLGSWDSLSEPARRASQRPWEQEQKASHRPWEQEQQASQQQRLQLVSDDRPKRCSQARRSRR